METSCQDIVSSLVARHCIQYGYSRGMKNNIRNLRDSEGLSQGELAAMVGKKKAAISKWEGKDVRLLTVENIMGVADALNCQPIEVFDPGRALTADELALVNAYRLMNGNQRALTTRLVSAVRPESAGQEDGRPHPFPRKKSGTKAARGETSAKTRVTAAR